MSNKMDKRRLWAKSWTEDQQIPESAYLPGHLMDVYNAATKLLSATGESQLRAFGLLPTEWLHRFHRLVSFAAALHDLGKCNSQFQDMLKYNGRQALRHEWVTLLIIDRPDWRNWLIEGVGGNENDWKILRWCISGHHPRYDRSAPPELAEGPRQMQIHLNNADIRSIINWLRDTFNLGKSELPQLSDRTIDLTVGGDQDLEELYQQYYDNEDFYDDTFASEFGLRSFIAAAKDSLIAADIAGSALPRLSGQFTDDNDRWEWVNDVLNPAKLPKAKDYRRIVAKRLDCQPDEVDDKLREFQREAGEKEVSGDGCFRQVKLVKAGCGTGKTLAAYRWAEAHCDGQRLYVCYPTTGTATEGFRDYLLDPALVEHVKTDLMHGRRRVDFKLLRADEDRNADVARVESLDLWRIPVVGCTVDTVLGVVQNNRRGLYSWPALSQGGFVFDEIHSYDDKLFDALLHFLGTVRGAPVLLMTASLPTHRRKEIETVLSANNEVLIEIEGPKSLEELPRYHQHERVDPDPSKVKPKDVIEEIANELRANGKVLRVVNTVGAAIREAERLEEAGFKSIVYHSRFRYIDRVKQHQRVVDAFDPDKNPGRALAVCTQVAEMSLDLSATLLVTDLAPVSALIQRLGRLNRRAKTIGDPTRPFIVTDPEGSDGRFSPLPYDADELETSRKWLAQLWKAKLADEQRNDAEQWTDMVAAIHLEGLQQWLGEMEHPSLEDVQHWLEKHWLSHLSKREQRKARKWLEQLDESSLEHLQKWLPHFQALGGLSQRDLADSWEVFQDTTSTVARYQSAWLDYGPSTPVLELREGSPSMTIILEEDWEALRIGHKSLAEVAIPMPVPPSKHADEKFDWQAGEFNGVPFAKKKAIVYEPDRGARWQAGRGKSKKKKAKRIRQRSRR